MAFKNAQQARCLIGILHASAYTRNAATQSSTDMRDVTTLADTTKAFIPGQDTSTFSIDGPLDVDATANGQYDALADQKAATTPTPITFGTDGLTRGSTVWLIQANETTLTTSATQTGTVDWALTAQTDGRTDFNGVSLVDLAAVTIDTNGTSTNNGASSANGGVAHLHVTAFSGLSSDVITIEHSVNDSTWATLATFTTVTGLTSERIVVAAGTTVNQYLRVVDDVTGIGSCTRQVSFARR